MYYTFCTPAYESWLTLLVRSIRSVDKTTPILVLFSGQPSDAAASVLKQAQVRLRELLVPIPPNSTPSEILTYRALNTLRVLEEERYEWLMAMDADLLVRRPLVDLIQSIPLFDMAAVIRTTNHAKPLPQHLSVSGALVVLTRRSVPLFAQVVDMMENRAWVRGIEKGAWYWDQACLSEAVIATDLRVRTMPRELYLSSRPFFDDAYIWNGNFRGGSKQAALLAFERECERLERPAFNNKVNTDRL